ncbi:MAG: N-acetyltransferase family protein [Rhodospirillales bacterium]
MMENLEIRPARETDFAEITAIYAHHVRHGTASFEEVPPSVQEMMERWRKVTGSGNIWLVAADAVGIHGYAYTTPFHVRPAYRFTIENAVYVAHDAARRGIGKALMKPLIEHARTEGRCRMIAVIGDSANAGSIGLHEFYGFRHIGVLEKVGYKFERWIDVVMMQLDIQPEVNPG